MRFKLDENMPIELCDDLRSLGFEADTVPDEGLMEAPDAIVPKHARRDGRVFLTMDKGTVDVRRFPPREYAGIILFRPASTGRGAVLAFARRHLPRILESDLTGWLVVVGERSIRIR